ncbi:MAG TPA: pyridoxal-phosphate dependent enzyme, partial [Chitinophagaceae bacterium]|nr:pyridoxal-phosphate dependent enzyme [Chitinophagaceae bacterium]
MKDILHPEKIFIQKINADWLRQNNVKLDVLRLDMIHPVISGNKWFKLKYYLQEAKHKHYNTVATFGGAFSNHIIATACACNKAGLKSIGIIRGEGSATLSSTLLLARQYGMEIQFVSRSVYRDKEMIKTNFKNVYWIPEGGYGNLGIQGAREILSFCNELQKYTHIICAAGTGTMMAGIIQCAHINQKVIGVSVMKGNYSLAEQVKALIGIEHQHKLYNI